MPKLSKSAVMPNRGTFAVKTAKPSIGKQTPIRQKKARTQEMTRNRSMGQKKAKVQEITRNRSIGQKKAKVQGMTRNRPIKQKKSQVQKAVRNRPIRQKKVRGKLSQEELKRRYATRVARRKAGGESVETMQQFKAKGRGEFKRSKSKRS